MQYRLMALVSLLMLTACGGGRDGDTPGDIDRASKHELIAGFIDAEWDAEGGRLLLQVEQFDEPFLYQSSLARGVGSNNLGLDRGRLGETRVVRFERSGPKVLLIEDNLAYRARSDDAAERRAVTESFARSVIWGFEAISESDEGVLVDGTDFFLRDADGLAARLARLKEGQYRIDATRSAIYLPQTKGFPDNTEVEAIVTFTGQPSGAYLPTVVPDPRAVSVHLHHSFIRLPDNNYEPIAYDPRSGLYGIEKYASGFADFAAPIGEPVQVNFGERHRLEKQNADAEVSEAVEPIIYYVDPGAPEPVRTALIEGASWWNQAFEAAGYKDAFQVQLLPDDADPMDVRYNVIQWVHRSARGWSYGRSVVDPRTGEIIKGQVTLGSLRVRQDYLIIEGLLAPYADTSVPNTMLDVSLARIRQLVAHEVGHTLGFEHNFAASTQARASVMDYPFPLVRFDDDGELDFSAAYAEGIGSWDKRMVLYAYQDFAGDGDPEAARQRIIDETIQLGYKYVGGADSRSISSAHPDGNLLDNGSDAIAELEHLINVRAHALGRFSVNNIRSGRPLATLEEALVPVYLLHRYQVEAVGKLIGGSYFDYAMRGDGQDAVTPVSEARQREAIAALLATLDPALLRLPEGLAEQIPPRPPGYPKTREAFAGSTGVIFDPLAPAASATELTLDVLLDPLRAARMVRSAAPGFETVIDGLLEMTWFAIGTEDNDAAIQRQTNQIVLQRLMQFAGNMQGETEARAIALDAINRIDTRLAAGTPEDRLQAAHYLFASQQIERWRRDPAMFETIAPITMPPGSPIGALTE
jgi:hypothetical protein